MDSLQVSAIHNRIRTLKGFCSPTDPELPSAILLIAGLDGRQNKFSTSLFKYFS